MTETMTLAIAIVVVVCGVMIIGFLVILVRRQQSQLIDAFKQHGLPPERAEDLPGQDAIIRSLSERIAALEGRIPALAGQLESFTALTSRLASLEASMPSIQEAYEHYSDAINRADKRDTERARRVTKTRERKTGADAVNEMMPEVPAPVEQAPTNNAPQKRAGVLGQGTRGRG